MATNKANSCTFSFEVFPPKKFDKDGNPVDISVIFKTLDELRELHPDFISVTYGAAGGGNCENTLAIARRIKDVCGTPSVAHLAGVYLTKADALNVLTQFKRAGIENILALRGDKVANAALCGDFLHASDLIEFIKEFDSQFLQKNQDTIGAINESTLLKHKPFKIFGACYPEKHFEASSDAQDIDNLKKKVDTGATRLLSQLFFDNEKFYRFLDRARAAGVSVPIEAGIMPATSLLSITRMVKITGATLPRKFTQMMEHFACDPNALRDAGINYAIDQITDLIVHGVDGVHLYTMNNSYVARRITYAVSSLLGRENSQVQMQ